MGSTDDISIWLFTCLPMAECDTNATGTSSSFHRSRLWYSKRSHPCLLTFAHQRLGLEDACRRGCCPAATVASTAVMVTMIDIFGEKIAKVNRLLMQRLQLSFTDGQTGDEKVQEASFIHLFVVRGGYCAVWRLSTRGPADPRNPPSLLKDEAAVERAAGADKSRVWCC